MKTINSFRGDNNKKTRQFNWVPDDIKKAKFQDFLNSIGLILNSIQGHSSVLCLKKETVGL